MKIPPSSSKTICFARRRAPVTTRPRTSSTVGDTVRSTKGLARRMSRSISPVTRRSRWSTYTVRSGSSGIRWRRSGVLVRPACTASRTCGAKYVIWRRVHLSTLPRETSAPRSRLVGCNWPQEKPVPDLALSEARAEEIKPASYPRERGNFIHPGQSDFVMGAQRIRYWPSSPDIPTVKSRSMRIRLNR